MRRILFFFLIFLTSCKFTIKRTNNEADRNEAEKVVDSFYVLLGQRDIEGTLRLFHTKFFAESDTNKFKDFLVNISGQLPILRKRKLDHWRTATLQGLNAGTIDSLYYINKYDGFEMKIFVILQSDDIDDDNKIKIISFNYTPLPPVRINNDTDKAEGEKVVDYFYQLLSQNKIDECAKLFNARFFKTVDLEKFKIFLGNTNKQMPLLKERKLDHWSTKMAQGLDIDVFDSLYYICKYQDFDMKTSFILQNDNTDSSNKVKIVSFKTSAESFL